MSVDNLKHSSAPRRNTVVPRDSAAFRNAIGLLDSALAQAFGPHAASVLPPYGFMTTLLRCPVPMVSTAFSIWESGKR
jgi:hypothetical protein